MEVELELLEKQEDFVFADAPLAAYIGGVGAGKSFALSVWAVIQALTYPDAKGLVCANTYAQLKDATLPAFRKVADLLGIEFDYNRQSHDMLFNGTTTIHWRSLENFNVSMRGPEYSWAACDEAGYARHDAFKAMLSRVREGKAQLPAQIRLASTPVGFNWLYDVFVTGAAELAQKFLETSDPAFAPVTQLFQAKTLDNVTLDQSYLKLLTSQFDSKTAQQELDGQFVNLTSGKVYYNFDRRVNVRDFTPPPGIVRVGSCDFNVNPICGLTGFVQGDTLYIENEIYIKDSSTFALAASFQKLLPRGSYIFPDATGKARKTSASKTDHQILREAGFELKNTLTNPFEKDRFNAVNSLLAFRRIVINPRCLHLILDLEMVAYDNNSPELTHPTDCLGYLVWGFFPIKRPSRVARSYSI